MPDERRYEDSQIDEIGILRNPAEQSGNFDRGHIQERRAAMTGDDAAVLNEIQNHYYAGQLSYVDLESHLRDAGYSDDQVTTLANSFHAEYSYRNTHDGTPSNLAPNQITYLYDQFRGNIRGVHIIYPDNPNIPPTRYSAGIHEEGGFAEVELPLPAPIPVDVLTDSQKNELEQAQQIADILNENVANQPPTGRLRELDDFDRRTINEGLNNFYTGRGNLVDLANYLTTNIFELNNLDNNNQIISDILMDAQTEKTYRQNNNGRPSAISQELYDYIRNNNLQSVYDQLSRRDGSIQYTGQAIYIVPGTNTYYILTPTGRAILPVLDDQGQPTDPDLLPTTIERQLPSQLLRLGGRGAEISREQGTGLRSQFNEGLTIEQQNSLADTTALLMNQDLNLTAYLMLINNQYNLSQNQYRYLVQYVVENPHLETTQEELQQVNLYSDEVLFPIVIETTGRNAVLTEGQYRNYLSQRGNTDEEIDNIINPIKVRFDRLHEVQVYGQITSHTEIRPSEGGGVANLLGQLSQGSIRPQDVIDAYTNQQPVGVRQDPVTEQPIIPSQSIREPVSLDPPLQSIIEPLDPNYRPEVTITPSSIPTPSQSIAIGLGEPSQSIETTRFQPSLEENIEIRGYKNYYESNQSLYVGFREEFKDILPSITGMIGGGISFSFFRARDRGYLGQVLRQNRILLDLLLHRLEEQATQLANTIQRREENRQRLEEARGGDLTEEQLRQRGYERLDLLNLARGQLAGLEDDPDLNPQDLERNVQRLANNLAENNALLRQNVQNRDLINNLESEINLIENDIQQLENDLTNTQTERVTINQEFTDIINRDYSLLQEIQENLPQILQGFTIGVALGQVLSGYVFPTYIEEEPSTGNEFKTEIPQKTEKASHKKSKSNNPQAPPEEKAKEVILSGTLDKPYRSDEYFNKNIIPGQMKYSRSKGRPLNGRELREIKSILNKEELARFEGKNLFFNPKGKIETKDASKCMSLVKKPIVGIDPNKSRIF